MRDLSLLKPFLRVSPQKKLLLHKHNIDAGMFGNSVADLGLLKS